MTPKDAHNPRIGLAMLIDDEAIDQMIYRRVIGRSGCVSDVISFNYAEDALVYLKNPDNPKVDVIFLDINMPRMNGFQFLEAATKQLGPVFARSVIVMLTTSLDPLDHERAARFPVVQHFIQKPLTVEDVTQVASALDHAPAID